MSRTICQLADLVERPAGCAAAIGNFDGVHRGHQAIIALARRLADEAAAQAIAVTFDPPPVKVLAPEKAPQPLMQVQQKCQALLQAGADRVVLLPTTRELLAMSPEEFVRDVLVARLGPRHVVQGRNFFFGHNRTGNVDTLRELGRPFGFDVHAAEVLRLDLAGESAVAVSSSLVRRLLAEGRVEDAQLCLGRPHALRGVIVRGHGVGRQLEFPTANLDCGEQLVPAEGVYAGFAELKAERFPAAISVGRRPTFHDTAMTVEAFLLGAHGEFYGREMDLAFTHRLREQRTFDSPEQLRRQMDKDVERVRELLG